MKGICKAIVIATTAFSATSVFAAGFFSRNSEHMGRTYTDSAYWRTPSASTLNAAATAGASAAATGNVVTNGPIVAQPAEVVTTTPNAVAVAPGAVVTVPNATVVAPGPTMQPYMPGDTISNASSSLWGVGG
jgi:hypothetical protein